MLLTLKTNNSFYGRNVTFLLLEKEKLFSLSTTRIPNSYDIIFDFWKISTLDTGGRGINLTASNLWNSLYLLIFPLMSDGSRYFKTISVYRLYKIKWTIYTWMSKLHEEGLFAIKKKVFIKTYKMFHWSISNGISEHVVVSITRR